PLLGGPRSYVMHDVLDVIPTRLERVRLERLRADIAVEERDGQAQPGTEVHRHRLRDARPAVARRVTFHRQRDGTGSELELPHVRGLELHRANGGDRGGDVGATGIELDAQRP